MNRPLRHVSIRVPWHDTEWYGRVRAALRLNGAGLRQKGIAEKRNDDANESVAGCSITDLPQATRPSCIAEHVASTTPFEYVPETDHSCNRARDNYDALMRYNFVHS